jgi:tetratricopeptide (TPR) repeat protein
MSVVYRAHDRLREREVALKLLKLSEEEPRNLLYLQQEFRAMARLRHPRLVQVLDYGVLDNGSSYLTMELLAGEDLCSLGRLSLQTIFEVLLSIADVLGFMHARGYVHRDVKPANVRLLPTAPGQPIEVKLMDCGLTVQLGREGGAVAGTLAYLAPEAWLGSPTDVRGDLYALGVLAYEITAGFLPFDVSTGVRLLKTKTERPRDLRETRSDVPAEFARLVSDLLAPEPANRPASATEVVARLCEFADIDFHPDPTVYLRTPALVGRARELAALRDAITEACAGKPNPTIIVGPAGAGKTRLLDEALLEMGLRGAVIARATGRGFAGAPYEVLQDLIAPLLHLPAAEAVLARIGGAAALGPAHPNRAGDGALRSLDPVAARWALHLAFATFLDGISKHRTIVLAIDDIHLADAASLDVLTGLFAAEIYGNIAIVATQRAGEAVSLSLARLLTNARPLEIDRMTRTQIGELIVGALGPVTPSPTLLEDLERVSSGNVYFVLEILRSLSARCLIERKRTRILLPDSLDTAGLPQSLSEALERRVALLSAGALDLARVVAVVGRAIDFDFARVLFARSDEEFLDAIDDLRREELASVRDRQLHVHHPRLREVLYQGMSTADRQTLHRHVAEQIQRRQHDGDRDRAAELGYHFAEAGEKRQALEYLVKAGDGRYQGFAYFDAREAYQRAFELLDSAPVLRQRELERKLNDRLGRICFYHDHRHGPKYLERARRQHLSDGMLWAIAPISRLLGAAVAVTIGVLATALWNVARFRSRPLQLTLERLMDAFAASTYLANCYTYSGRLQSALDAAECLVPFVYSRRRLPRVGYLMARAYALVLMNRFDEAAQGAEEALSVLSHDLRTPVSEHDRVHATGGALITRLWVDLTRGYSRSSRWWLPLEQYVHDHPTALLESWLQEVRVFSAFRQGKLAEIEEAWSRVVDKASQTEVVFVQSKTKIWVGMTYLDAGRTSEAQDIADEVIRVARSLDNPMLLALGLQLRGLALHAWEQLADAEQCLEEAAQLTAQQDVASWELHDSVLLGLATLALDRGNLARAKELSCRVEARNASLTLSHDLHCCRANRVLGRVALACGQIDDAVDRIERSLTLASEIDDTLERARCLHFLAQALTERGDATAAEPCRTECVQLLVELGNGYQLRRLGYAAADSPSSASGVNVLSRVIQLVSETDLPVTSPRQATVPTTTSGRGRAKAESLLDLSETAVREETLVATDTSGSFPSRPG